MYYSANTGLFFFDLLVVLLSELNELSCTHLVVKPELLLAYMRADLDIRTEPSEDPLIPCSQ